MLFDLRYLVLRVHDPLCRQPYRTPVGTRWRTQERTIWKVLNCPTDKNREIDEHLQKKTQRHMLPEFHGLSATESSFDSIGVVKRAKSKERSKNMIKMKNKHAHPVNPKTL